jgi:hypothetical protein
VFIWPNDGTAKQTSNAAILDTQRRHGALSDMECPLPKCDFEQPLNPCVCDYMPLVIYRNRGIHGVIRKVRAIVDRCQIGSWAPTGRGGL